MVLSSEVGFSISAYPTDVLFDLDWDLGQAIQQLDVLLFKQGLDRCCSVARCLISLKQEASMPKYCNITDSVKFFQMSLHLLAIGVGTRLMVGTMHPSGRWINDSLPHGMLLSEEHYPALTCEPTM